MKQRISPEQLQELTEAQKERLRKWWSYNYQVGDICSCSEYFEECCVIYNHDNSFGVNRVICSPIDEGELRRDRYNHFDNKPIPLLSIGQCIELLFDLSGYDEVSGLFIGVSRHYAEIFKGWCNCEEGITEGKSHILIDALWEAVKKVL